MIGLKSINANTSFSRSIPGAISVNSKPLGVNLNTARSVTYNTGCSTLCAYLPEKVTCSTSLRNFLFVPS